jgi:hypothetical protein
MFVYYLGTVWCTVLFILCIACFWSLLFRRCELQKSSRPSGRRLWAIASGKSRQVFFDHSDPICFLPLVTQLHVLVGLPTPYIPIGLGLWLINLLSPTVMSAVQVFPSYMMLSLTCVFVRVFGLPSVEMWFDRGEDRCCDLSKVGMLETVEIRQVMWIVMLESAKDRILGVDTPGLHVPPCVRYGTTCWLTRKALVSLSCWKSETGMAIPTRPQGARGVWGYSIVPKRGKH